MEPLRDGAVVVKVIEFGRKERSETRFHLLTSSTQCLLKLVSLGV